MLLATAVFWLGRNRFVRVPPAGKDFVRETFSAPRVKIIAGEVLPFEVAVGKLTTSVHFRLQSEGLRREDLEAMREVFQDCRGNCPAFLHLILPGEKEAVIDLGEEWKLNSTDQLVHRIRDLLGYEAVSFQA